MCVLPLPYVRASCAPTTPPNATRACAQKRRKALSGKAVTVDSTVEGGMVFQEPLPKVVLVREPLMRVEGHRVEDMESFDPQ